MDKGDAKRCLLWIRVIPKGIFMGKGDTKEASSWEG
jgi:hypothetical protein